MKLVVLVAVVACGSPKPEHAPAQQPGPVQVSKPSWTLPADAELGEIAIMPNPTGDLGSWLPQGTFPFLVEATLREGKGHASSWLAIDGAGSETTLTYGETAHVRYGCDNGELTVAKLDGKAMLKPGLVWLRPTAHVGWKPKPLAITDDRSLPGGQGEVMRGYRVGVGRVQLVRQQAKRGVANVTWKHALHVLLFKREDMQGADNKTPMDLSTPGVGQPVPEAAWSFGPDDDALLIVFRIPGYEGDAFTSIVLHGAQTQAAAREVESMTMYLYRCAF